MITVKNVSLRAFAFPGKGDIHERVVAPGDAKEIELTTPVYKFVSAYVNAGELEVISGELKNPESDEVVVSIDELRVEAEELGIKVDARWKKSRLQQEIEAAKAAS